LYKDNQPTTQYILDHIQQQTGSQSTKLSDYVRYDDDTQCYGHAPGPINESETWRIIGGNSNGLRSYGDMADLISISKRTQALQAGTIALSETNTEWHKHELRTNTDKVLTKTFGAARTEYGTSSDKYETSNYKQGGTLCSALGPWGHMVCVSGRDNTGCVRWTYLTYNARDGKKITVSSAYRVGKPNSGCKTASRQQEKIQYADEVLRPYLVDPYKQTLIDLQYFVQELQSQDLKHEVIVMIDGNKDEDQQYCDQGHTTQYTTSRHFHVDGPIDGSLHTFMGNFRLRNALREFHGGVVPNTHMRRSKHIDFMLTTGGLTNSIEATGLLDCSVLNSDHRALSMIFVLKIH
jgi:hypothetical protein